MNNYRFDIKKKKLNFLGVSKKKNWV